MMTLFRKMRAASIEDKPNLRDHWLETAAEILNPKKTTDKETTSPRHAQAMMDP